MPNELLAVGEGMSPLVMWGIVALVVLLALSIIKKLVKPGILVAILLVLIFVVRALMAQTI
jgi:hypothetical protein